MSTALLDRVIAEVKTLTPAEQAKVREVLEGVLPSAEKTPSRAEYEQYLLRKGAVSHIPTRQSPSSARKAFAPIEVEGLPISQTIIEERR